MNYSWICVRNVILQVYEIAVRRVRSFFWKNFCLAKQSVFSSLNLSSPSFQNRWVEKKTTTLSKLNWTQFRVVNFANIQGKNHRDISLSMYILNECTNFAIKVSSKSVGWFRSYRLTGKFLTSEDWDREFWRALDFWGKMTYL